LESWLAWEFWLGEVGPVGFRAQQPISTILQGGWALENSWPLSWASPLTLDPGPVGHGLLGIHENDLCSLSQFLLFLFKRRFVEFAAFPYFA
jgi:hypothetical protein